jgi:hypothetical protein
MSRYSSLGSIENYPPNTVQKIERNCIVVYTYSNVDQLIFCLMHFCTRVATNDWSAKVFLNFGIFAYLPNATHAIFSHYYSEYFCERPQDQGHTSSTLRMWLDSRMYAGYSCSAVRQYVCLGEYCTVMRHLLIINITFWCKYGNWSYITLFIFTCCYYYRWWCI